MADESVLPTMEQLKRIIEYIPYFENRHNKFFDYIPPEENKNGTSHFPYYIYSEKVSDFISCLEEHKFLVSPYDQKCVRKYFSLLKGEIDSSELGILDIRNIFSFLLNADRFCEGQIARAINKGIFLKMLKRIEQIAIEIQVPLSNNSKTEI
ncbi:MAG: hypothetical protein GYA60_02345 [Candidatus Methanofastidiosa archaeon]|nr:hypothetical protein [Candidatus Methanofastidiosa archaeon]